MIHLLDINLLLALVDSGHPHHAAASAFFPQLKSSGWATCPLVVNGFLRILGGKGYPRAVASPQVARMILNRLREMPGYQFWPDDLSLCDGGVCSTLPGSQHLTDCYLLALAESRGGRLATFDRGIDCSFVKGGKEALFIVESAG